VIIYIFTYYIAEIRRNKMIQNIIYQERIEQENEKKRLEKEKTR
jgi:hypothetical protein